MRPPTFAPSQLQSRLLKLAAGFLFLYALILTLSPAVRYRSWDVDYRWSHWAGFALWALLVAVAYGQVHRHLPESDPYLLPLAALLSGWGLLTVWRLASDLGMRQGLWLAVSVGALICALRLPGDLAFLRRYKYLWLSGGLLLTALTLIFGTNPVGVGPRLWLGCCGVYLQPSEPLKLLLVVYLAAYLTDRSHLYAFEHATFLPLILPTLIMTGLALLLLLVQRDLGTASIFILLYAAVLYTASGRRRVLLASAAALLLAGVVGYFLIDVVHLRVDAWLDPWSDPSGRAYQIVQSLLAVANGGLLGRGPGLGSPGLVPIAHSDFVFTAIAEESGLAGTIVLLALLALLIARGLRAALLAPDRFRRLLAAGLTAYLGIQSILIIGGNLRLLPLTGVTLPFVSYGGSSLLTSFLALCLLLLIGGQTDKEPAPLPDPQPYHTLAALLGIGLIAAALANGWWAVGRGPDLLTRTDNPRRAIADRYVRRGALLDRQDAPINVTQGEIGSYTRLYRHPDLAPITGYTHPTYGQAGLEAGLDDYLRGLQGNPALLIWWHHLLYGQPPPGLDVRLSLDLPLQERADGLLGSRAGAIVLLNAANGEILAMASHPAFDPNALDSQGPELAKDPRAPLLNRAVQGQYPAAATLAPFRLAGGYGETLPEDTLKKFYAALGFDAAPALYLPVAVPDTSSEKLRISPLQMALAAAALSNNGLRPPPRLALAVNTPRQGWVILPPLGEQVQAFPTESAAIVAQSLMVANTPFWQFAASEQDQTKAVAWALAGTLPDWRGTPLAVVVVLEGDNLTLAAYIGQAMLAAASQP